MSRRGWGKGVEVVKGWIEVEDVRHERERMGLCR
jgi:hypothetical protein